MMFCGGVFLSRQEKSKHMLDIRILHSVVLLVYRGVTEQVCFFSSLF